jgi:TusA-related sulfurtransferase
MKKEMTIGPIQKSKTVDSVNTKVRKQMNKLKLGECFEVKGVDERTVMNLRAALSYYSKEDGIKVSTSLSKNTLVISRVRK